MKNLLLAFTTAFFLFACTSNSEKAEAKEDGQEMSEGHDHLAKDEDEEEKKKPLSPRTASMSNVGENHIHIDYGAPGKRGRIIFGGLVGYGQVWATGAHKATYISFSKDVIVEGVEIPAGKYGLFTIPGETEWTIIINKDWDMHLADDYNEDNDIVRINSPVRSLAEVVESLTFEVQEIDDRKGTITIKWDQTAVSFELENK